MLTYVSPILGFFTILTADPLVPASGLRFLANAGGPSLIALSDPRVLFAEGRGINQTPSKLLLLSASCLNLLGFFAEPVASLLVLGLLLSELPSSRLCVSSHGAGSSAI